MLFEIILNSRLRTVHSRAVAFEQIVRSLCWAAREKCRLPDDLQARCVDAARWRARRWWFCRCQKEGHAVAMSGELFSCNPDTMLWGKPSTVLPSRLCHPLGTAVAGQLVGADRFVAASQSFPSLGIAPKFPTDHGWRPAQGRCNLVLRYTACGISHALLKAELAITSSHRNNTLAGVALAS